MILIDLTGSKPVNKRPITDNKLDDKIDILFGKRLATQSGIPTIAPRIWSSTPYTISDNISFGEGTQEVFALVISDQVMVFLSENAAQSFGTLVTNIREKTGSDISLGTMAKLAGIDRSLILTMDMALHLPGLGSTAAMSLIKSITSIPIFTNDDDARELATKTSRFLRQNNWRLSASLNITAKRTLANESETFIPPLIVAEKLTHLGRPWKPLPNLRNGSILVSTTSVEIGSALRAASGGRSTRTAIQIDDRPIPFDPFALTTPKRSAPADEDEDEDEDDLSTPT
ncbi:hypothetical protein NW762_006929 [Fusarium torreyae]|uniref:Uncharacterized protein n=1 Tax=Fusarium torreyae TaxID=1237075 RepID=A0A9W8RZT0_9HYPO|nr:hypothetical protein NW762_006929 [Fusarium torreyae]